jgi:flagellar biosynthesis/type III secretory pathway protein FliH
MEDRMMHKQQDADVTGPSRQVRQTMERVAALETQARQCMLDARRQAQEIIQSARQQADRIRAQAQPADRPDPEDVDELVILARKLIGQLAAERDRSIHRTRRDVTELAFQLASMIVGEAAVADVRVARQNLQRAMQLTRRDRPVQIEVNAHQLDQLRQQACELVEALGFQKMVRLIGSEDVPPGGVRLTNSQGRIEANTESQLRRAAKALFQEPDGQESTAPTGVTWSHRPLPGMGEPIPAERTA